MTSIHVKIFTSTGLTIFYSIIKLLSRSQKNLKNISFSGWIQTFGVLYITGLIRMRHVYISTIHAMYIDRGEYVIMHIEVGAWGHFDLVRRLWRSSDPR